MYTVQGAAHGIFTQTKPGVWGRLGPCGWYNIQRKIRKGPEDLYSTGALSLKNRNTAGEETPWFKIQLQSQSVQRQPAPTNRMRNRGELGKLTAIKFQLQSFTQHKSYDLLGLERCKKTMGIRYVDAFCAFELVTLYTEIKTAYCRKAHSCISLHFICFLSLLSCHSGGEIWLQYFYYSVIFVLCCCFLKT